MVVSHDASLDMLIYSRPKEWRARDATQMTLECVRKALVCFALKMIGREYADHHS